jgi:hypothetical protein
MPIHYYTWTTSLGGENISFRILESSEDDARQQLLQKIQDFQTFRERYENFERQLHVNRQNKVFIEKKAIDAYAADDQSGVESLERALQMIHESSRRLRNEMRWFLDSLDIDTCGMIEEVSPFSFHLDAVVQTQSGQDMTLRQFLITTPTVTPIQKVEMFHNT